MGAGVVKTCIYCGGDGPFSENPKTGNVCKPCISERNKKYREEHREELREYQRKWRKEHPEIGKEYARKHYAKNIEKGRAERREYYRQNKEAMNARVRVNYHADRAGRLAIIRQWKDANPISVSASAARRRELILNASGTATVEQIEARVEFFGGMCAYCGVRPFEHIDHVISLAAGGTGWPANLRPACAKCNLSKNKKIWWFISLGRVVDGDRVSTDLWLLVKKKHTPKETSVKFDYPRLEKAQLEYMEALGLESPPFITKEMLQSRYVNRKKVDEEEERF